MSQSPNFKAILKKIRNFISHNKFPTALGLIFSFLGLIFSFLALPQLQQKETEKTLFCPNASYPITMKYPKNWVLDCTEDAPNGEFVKLLPQSNRLVRLSILVNQSREFMTLDDYTKPLIKIIKKNSNNVKVNTQATLGNRPAYELSYVVKGGKIIFKRQEIIMIEAGKAYHIIYEAPEYQYSSFESDAKMMIKSFSISKDK